MPRQVVLSTFQREKLKSFFNFLEPDAEGKLEAHSLDRIVKRILEFTTWQEGSAKAHHVREVCEAFFEILFEKSAGDDGTQPGQATLDNWYHIWEALLPGCKGMSNFPVWLRLMPKILFEMIDRNGDNLITADELEFFYRAFMKMDNANLEQKAVDAVKEMTDDGQYPLNLNGYEQIFANFLLGKTPHGPGKYVFGLFTFDSYHFELIRSADYMEPSPIAAKPRPMQRKPSRVTMF